MNKFWFNFCFKTTIIALLMMITAPAMAHQGIHFGLDFVSGLIHPFSGIDHLLVMFGIGVWAAILLGNSLLSQMVGFVCGAALLHIGGYSLAKQVWFSTFLQRLFGFLSCFVGGTLVLLH